jgi:hypothetical protein
METIEQQVQRWFKESHERSLRYGFKLDVIKTFFHYYYLQPDTVKYIGTGEYFEQEEQRYLKSYLGLREAEQEAMRKQLTPMQIKVNEFFG